MDNLAYHYTSTDTLWHLMESIKRSRDKDSFIFRATNILYMNDPQEFVYGQRILKKVFVEIENELGIEGKNRLSDAWNKYGKGNWEMSLLNKMKEYDEVPYVVSFSRLEDSLPMWLNYGNKGHGINLAFQDKRDQPYGIRIVNNKREPYTSFYTSDVFYHEIPKDSWLYKLIFETIKDYKNEGDEETEDLKEAYLEALVQTAAPLLKTSFYENEQEVRIFKSVGFDYGHKLETIEFKTNEERNLIPYIGIEIPVDQLKAVVIGPLADFELTKMAIELLQKKYGLDFEIKPSNVKYREY